MVLACDGIWDCMKNQEVIDYIRHALTLKKSLKLICEEIMDFCLAESGDMTGIGCDNMTIIIVAFLRKKATMIMVILSHPIPVISPLSAKQKSIISSQINFSDFFKVNAWRM